SLGDYFKKEKTAWSFELLTKVFGFDKDKICSTVFEGNASAPRDEETASYLKELGIKEENIFYLDKSNNWWELEGTVGTPCGPDNEWFYPRHDKPCCDKCDVNCDCGRYVEIGNDVYMQYKKLEGGKYEELENKNVDTGFGLDRLLLFLNGLDDGYKTDLFASAIAHLESASGKAYGVSESDTKAMRIIADHTRTAVMLIGDVNGITPSNTGAGYILRRLLRRAIRYCKNLGIPATEMCEVAKIFIEKIYDEAYPLLVEKEEYVLDEITKEIKKFELTLASGMKEFDKIISGMQRKNEFMSLKDPNYVPETEISGKQAFRLYDTFGYPLELTIELANERNLTVDEKGFNEAFKAHQELSKAQAQATKGGMAESNIETTHLHTATHLLLASLRKVLADDGVMQKGSNITSERLRVDFNFGRPLTQEEIVAVEAEVNGAIQAGVDIVCEEMTVEKAREQGAIGVFGDRYGEIVKVYTMGKYSKEICGGPHANNTKELGTFKIQKEQSSSSGVRRIK
ncbi:MAG: alanine--tRNA ligase, partial [Clostridia bacterium]|nr:alanine--tRNA ligase [Clostridia bacterium]